MIKGIKLQEQSLTMTLDGKKEEQSCPNDKKKRTVRFNGRKNERR